MYSSSKGTHQTLCLRNSRDGCCENIINRKKKKKKSFSQMILKCNRGRGSIKKKKQKKNTTTRKRIVFIWSRHECQQEEIWRRRRGSMKLLRVCSAAVLWDRRVLYIHFFFFYFPTHTHTHTKRKPLLSAGRKFSRLLALLTGRHNSSRRLFITAVSCLTLSTARKDVRVRM